MCCERDSLLTTMVEQLGGKAGRAGLCNGYDLLKKQGQEAFRSLWKIKRPRWIWVSLPCGPTSQAQGLNELTEEGWWKSQLRKKRSRKLALIATVLLQEYIDDGGEVVCEWPTGNGGWKFPEVQEFWRRQKDSEEIHLHGCQFGLKTSTGEPIKKPWRLNSTKSGTCLPMHRRCPGDHTHAQVLGTPELRRTALYSKEFCRVAARCMMKSLLTHAVLAVEEVKVDPDCLKEMPEAELERLTVTLLKLHRRCGHLPRDKKVTPWLTTCHFACEQKRKSRSCKRRRRFLGQ